MTDQTEPSDEWLRKLEADERVDFDQAKAKLGSGDSLRDARDHLDDVRDTATRRALFNAGRAFARSQQAGQEGKARIDKVIRKLYAWRDEFLTIDEGAAGLSGRQEDALDTLNEAIDVLEAAERAVRIPPIEPGTGGAR